MICIIGEKKMKKDIVRNAINDLCKEKKKYDKENLKTYLTLSRNQYVQVNIYYMISSCIITIGSLKDNLPEIINEVEEIQKSLDEYVNLGGKDIIRLMIEYGSVFAGNDRNGTVYTSNDYKEVIYDDKLNWAIKVEDLRNRICNHYSIKEYKEAKNEFCKAIDKLQKIQDRLDISFEALSNIIDDLNKNLNILDWKSSDNSSDNDTPTENTLNLWTKPNSELLEISKKSYVNFSELEKGALMDILVLSKKAIGMMKLEAEIYYR